jgi:hypothetical protein
MRRCISFPSVLPLTVWMWFLTSTNTYDCIFLSWLLSWLLSQTDTLQQYSAPCRLKPSTSTLKFNWRTTLNIYSPYFPSRSMFQPWREHLQIQA